MLYFVLTTFLTYSFIEDKKERLHQDIIDKLDNVFDNKSGLLDVEHYYQSKTEKSKYPPAYWQTDNPNMKEYYIIQDGGWLIVGAERCSETEFKTYELESLGVGYKKLNNYYDIQLIPTVESVIREALEYITEKEYTFAKYYQKGSAGNINNLKHIYNIYYKSKPTQSASGMLAVYTPKTEFYFSKNDIMHCFNLDASAVALDYLKYIGCAILLYIIAFYLVSTGIKKHEQ